MQQKKSKAQCIARPATRSKWISLERLKKGDHFKSESGMQGVLLDCNFSYAKVLIYYVPEFTNCTPEFAVELTNYYLGKLLVAPGMLVKQRKGKHDVKKRSPNLHIQPKEQPK